MNEGSHDLVEVLGTYNQVDLAIIKSVLDSEKIEYYLFDEGFSALQRVVPMRLMVKKQDLEKVNVIIKNFNYPASSEDKKE